MCMNITMTILLILVFTKPQESSKIIKHLVIIIAHVVAC